MLTEGAARHPLRRDTVVLAQVLNDPVLRWQWQTAGEGVYLAGFATEQDAMGYARMKGWRD